MSDNKRQVGSNGFREWIGTRKATSRLSHIKGSIAALADMAGLSASTLYRIRGGHSRNMLITTAQGLSKALGGEFRVDFGSGTLVVPKRAKKDRKS
jgi:hypothetical protein